MFSSVVSCAVRTTSICILLSFFTVSANDDFVSAFGEVDIVEVVTGNKQQLRYAPAIASVITSEELEAIGATTLSEALQLVPGINVMFRPQGDHYTVRGIHPNSNFNAEISILIDGIPMNDFHLGSQRGYMSLVPFQNIERIEVIRGPASALYGSNAIGGVVNIITKKPSSHSENMVSVRAGSFETIEGRALVTQSFDEFDTAFSIEVRNTDGFDANILHDGQTRFDQMFSTNASNAPADADYDYDDINALFEVSSDKWRLKYRGHKHQVGMGAGFTGALDPEGKAHGYQNNISLQYENPYFSDHWDVQGAVSYNEYDIDTRNVHIYPDGAFGGLFPEGVHLNPGYQENQWYADLSFRYSGFESHDVLIGTGLQHLEIDDLREMRNFSIDPTLGVPVPLGADTNITDGEDLWSEEETRIQYFLYAQDEWQMSSDWLMTTGIRFDHYDDFGNVVMPKVALVWLTSQDLTTKFIASRGFRAPTLLELYGKNNPSTLGSTDLNAVEMESYEVGLDYIATSTLQMSGNIFFHELSETIEYVDTDIGSFATNIEGLKGYGFEYQVRWQARNNVMISGQYSNQYNKSVADGSRIGFAPRHMIGLRADLEMNRSNYLNLNLITVFDRGRSATDTRNAVANYSIVDLTYRYNPQDKPWFMRFLIQNVFDDDANDPSDTGATIKHDFPLAGRSCYATIGLNF